MPGLRPTMTAVARRVRAGLRATPLLADGYRVFRLRRELRRSGVRTPHGIVLAGGAAQAREGFEASETRLLTTELLPAAELFVDVGANIGFYTCIANAAGLPVIAIEPMQTNLQFLFRNLEANDCRNVMVLPIALSSHVGVTRMFGGGTGASLVKGWAGASSRQWTWVPLARADDLLPALVQGRRATIKVDVEGAEADFLAGAHELLRSRPKPTWLVEITFHEHHPTGRHPRFREVFEAFWDAGYVVKSLPEQRVVSDSDIERWLSRGERDFGSHSYVIVPDDDLGGAGARPPEAPTTEGVR